jgi:Uma2 family endonuclease
MNRAAGTFTVDDYLSLPADAPRCELVEGVLHVTPAPNRPHQDLVFEIARRLDAHARRRKLGRMMVSPFDVVLGPTTVVQPDVLFVASARRDEVLGGGLRAYGAPDLVVEVLSPSTRRLDVTAKRRVYSRAGVRELWFVDVEERSLEVWRRGPRALVRRETLGADDVLASDVVPGYRVRVGLLFAYLDA